jgi:hypothetical protein
VACFRRWFKGAKAVRLDGLLVPGKKVGKKWVPDLDDLPVNTNDVAGQAAVRQRAAA